MECRCAQLVLDVDTLQPARSDQRPELECRDVELIVPSALGGGQQDGDLFRESARPVPLVPVELRETRERLRIELDLRTVASVALTVALTVALGIERVEVSRDRSPSRQEWCAQEDVGSRSVRVASSPLR